MKIVVACGGTGGHTFPGLAVAEELLKRGHEVVVWTSGRSIEESVMKRWTGEVFATGAKPLQLKNLIAIIRSFFRCRKELRQARPDAMLAMGSYSSLPPVLAARLSGIKVYLHEANTVPGKAVDFLSRFADKVAISFKSSTRYLPNAQTVLTGLPIREDIVNGKRFDFIPPNTFTIFVTGGSQGAHAVNELTCKALVMLAKEVEKPIYIIHQTGAKDESWVKAEYDQAGIPSRVHAFEREMANAFASADIVIARAGASTCFELAACAKPALFIPLPTAMRNHQHFNAEAFAICGAADEGAQDRLNPRSLERYLAALMTNDNKRSRMSEKMRELSLPNASALVADMIEGK